MPIVFADSYQLPDDQPSGADQFFTAMFGGLAQGVQRGYDRADRNAQDDKDYQRRMAELAARVAADRESNRQAYEMRAPERELQRLNYERTSKYQDDHLGLQRQQLEQAKQREANDQAQLALEQKRKGQEYTDKENIKKRDIYAGQAQELGARTPAFARLAVGGQRVPGLGGAGINAMTGAARAIPGVTSGLAYQEAQRLADAGGIPVQSAMADIPSEQQPDQDILSQAYQYRDKLPPEMRAKFMQDLTKRLDSQLGAQREQMMLEEQKRAQQETFMRQQAWAGDQQRYAAAPDALADEIIPDAKESAEPEMRMLKLQADSLARMAPLMDAESFLNAKQQIAEQAFKIREAKNKREHEVLIQTLRNQARTQQTWSLPQQVSFSQTSAGGDWQSAVEAAEEFSRSLPQATGGQ